jgi:predicted transcriptional regulator
MAAKRVEEPVSTSELEKKIATALADKDIASSNLAALIAETETAIAAADQAAEAEREKALDPALSPDPKAAREAIVAAEFARDRLRTLLPRLQEAQAAEYAARWASEYERVQAKRDELARRYAEYPKLVARLVDLFGSAKALDEEVSRVNGSAPPGEHRRLRGVELSARGLKSFSTADPPIAKGVQLPDWAHSARTVWPPPRPFDPASFAPVSFDRRLSAEWGLVQEEGRAMPE